MARTSRTRERAASAPAREGRTAPEGSRPEAIQPFLHRTHTAYFSMELAVRPEMHTYCGGLGLLAGDTARECADLELPVVFVTMLSRLGYLRQEIGPSGEQLELPDRWDPKSWCLPLPTRVAVEVEGRSVVVRPWLTVLTGSQGFRVPVLLLDTDLSENSEEDRKLTDTLYGGDVTYQLKQEIVLGLGGLRVLRALGFDLRTYHMNEGHAALLTLDLLRDARRGPGKPTARRALSPVEEIRRRCVFTTHTPVKAGHHQYGYSLFERLLPGEVDPTTLRSLAGTARLNLTLLGMNLSGYINGVSRQHADTARQMFPRHRIHAVTNGVHLGTWTHRSFARLYDRRIPRWREEPELLVRALHLAEREVWDCHQVAKRELLQRVRRATEVSLEPETLTIGFARRMTAYKRPLLLFEDPGRLGLLASRRRFQVLLAGKAHPHDKAGREAVQRLHELARELDGRLSCVFLANYDMEWAKALVAGCDVWLNTPMPPMEASGTSGIKAALNGGLNLSILDGWWAEGCVEGVNGWSIPHSKGTHTDRRDAASLYDRLEHVVLPCFYNEPQRWRAMMKQAIGHVGSYFNTRRMLRQYATEAYLH
jgi:glycogen phosphorylase